MAKGSGGGIGSLRVDLALDSAKFATGLKSAQTKLGKFSGEIQGSLNQITGITKSGMGALASAFAVTFSFGHLVSLADTYTDLNSRVGLSIGSMDQSGEVMNRLNGIARQTYSSLETTAEGFLQNVDVLKDLGLSTNQALDYTSALNNAMVISGAKGDAAASVQKALSDAMVTGKLSGDGLNTVLTKGGEVAKLLAAELGTNVSGLRKMGADGKITGNIIKDSLLKNMDDLATRAGDMPATVGDALTLLNNALLNMAGKTGGVMSLISDAIIFVADNLQRFVTYAGVAAVAYGTTYVGGMVAAAVATGGLSGALKLLRSALISTGIGAIVVLVGEAINQFMTLSEEVGGVGSAFTILGGTASSTWEWIKAGGNSMVDAFSGICLSIGAFFTQLWADIKTGFANLMVMLQGGINTMIDGLNSAFTFEITNPITGSTIASMNGLIDTTANFADGFVEGAKETSNAAKKMSEDAAAAFERAKGHFSDLETPIAAFTRLKEEAIAAAKAAKEANGGGVDLNQGNIPTNTPADTKGKGGKGKGDKDAKSQLKAYEDLQKRVASLKFGLTETELAQRIFNEQQKIGSAASKEAVAELVQQEDRLEKFKNAIEEVGSSFVSNFTDMLNGTKSFKQAFGGILGDIGQMLMKSALTNMWKNLITPALGGLAGGGGFLGGALKLFGFAKGTSSAPYTGSYLVGEQGPEIVSLPSGSRVATNGQTNRILNNASQASAGGASAVAGLIQVALSPDLVGNIINQSRENSIQITKQGISNYDKQVLPSSLQRVSGDSRRRG